MAIKDYINAKDIMKDIARDYNTLGKKLWELDRLIKKGEKHLIESKGGINHGKTNKPR